MALSELPRALWLETKPPRKLIHDKSSSQYMQFILLDSPLFFLLFCGVNDGNELKQVDYGKLP